MRVARSWSRAGGLPRGRQHRGSRVVIGRGRARAADSLAHQMTHPTVTTPPSPNLVRRRVVARSIDDLLLLAISLGVAIGLAAALTSRLQPLPGALVAGLGGSDATVGWSGYAPLSNDPLSRGLSHWTIVILLLGAIATALFLAYA